MHHWQDRAERTGATGVGMMKRMKDMRDMVDAAPGMVGQAQQLGAQVQQLAAARLATVDPSNPRPIRLDFGEP